MMLCDWQIFWLEHRQRPTITPFELEMFIMQDGFQRMAEAMNRALAPALNQFATSVTKFLATLKEAQKK